MSKLGKTAYLTIHGHFYQPPRENPWTERIELQPDAQPFHDWNDRILIQCYRPNAMSRLVDHEGKVLEIVNNFRLLSFNVGPTLLSWIEKNDPPTYRRILEGDRLSQRERSGHGNALAQVYNHMILPLAEERDQRTQIRWGIFEFKKRFERDPEGIWLPETAANDRTLEILIEEGIRFTILAPHQAEKIRRIGSASWEDVSQGSIDPTRPYRFFHSKDPNRSLDLFFFDGPLSRDVSFGDLLLDAQRFLKRLLSAHRPERNHPEFVHVASDGETFGHHKAFGERVVTYLLHQEAERRGFKRMNYGEYLEKFPPQFEVKVKSGEGTSWSCAHGVGRWKEDCGCQAGGGPGWNQKWRAPLREAVRFLGRELAKLYEEQARNFFRDPWSARDGTIELILDRSQETRNQFFKRHGSRPLSGEDEIRALKLLEMERHAMLTETSCGWFFNDLSGIETVQILRYALRALELAAEFGGGELEKKFVELLEQAKTNRPEWRDGRGVWEKLVRPARVSREKLVSHYAFLKLFEWEIPLADFYGYEVKEGEFEQEEVGETTLLMGTVRLTGRTIPESQAFLYALFREKLSRFQCFVKPLRAPEELQKANVAPLADLRKGKGAELTAHLRQWFGSEPFLLRHLFPEEREKIVRALSREVREELYQTVSRFFEKNRTFLGLFRESGGPVPEEFRGITEWVMGERLLEIVEKLEGEGESSREDLLQEAAALLEEARSGGLSLRTEPAIQFLSARLNDWIEKLFHEPDPSLVQKIEKVLQLSNRLGLALYARIAQDLFFVFAQKMLRGETENLSKEATGAARMEMIQAVIRLGGELGFNMKPSENQLKQKAEVR